MTSREFVPVMIRLRYVGRIASKSMIPKKLLAYRSGRLTLNIRAPYSTVKSTVKNHSAMASCQPNS